MKEFATEIIIISDSSLASRQPVQILIQVKQSVFLTFFEFGLKIAKEDN